MENLSLKETYSNGSRNALIIITSICLLTGASVDKVLAQNNTINQQPKQETSQVDTQKQIQELPSVCKEAFRRVCNSDLSFSKRACKIIEKDPVGECKKYLEDLEKNKHLKL